MNHLSTIGRSIGAVGVAALLSVGLATSGFANGHMPTGDNANDPENWETFLEEEGYTDVECDKIEEGLTGDTFTSPSDFLLVVLKAGQTNDLFWDVEEGDELTTESGQDISHVIVCTGEKETPSPTPSTSTSTSTSTPTSTPTTTTPGGPTGPVVETDIPDTGGSSMPTLLGGAAVLAGLGLAFGAMRRQGQH